MISSLIIKSITKSFKDISGEGKCDCLEEEDHEDKTMIIDFLV